MITKAAPATVQTQKSFVDGLKHVTEIRANKFGRLLTYQGEYKGELNISARVTYFDDNNEELPTKKGITLSPDEVVPFIHGLMAAAEITSVKELVALLNQGANEAPVLEEEEV